MMVKFRNQVGAEFLQFEQDLIDRARKDFNYTYDPVVSKVLALMTR